MLRKFFVLIFLALLILPWFPLPQLSIYGAENDAQQLEFSWNDFVTKKFQNQYELWYNRYFGSRKTMLVIKNSIFSLLNFGQFHSGYTGNVLQGKEGVLYEKGYILVKYTPWSLSAVENNATEAAEAISKLQDILRAKGKDIIFIMAPSKADCREESLPPLWQYRAKHVDTVPSMLPVWEDALKKRNILYVNGFEILKKRSMLKDSFPDTGTHWSLLGAGVVWEEAVKTLREGGVLVPEIKISNIKTSNIETAEERDISKLLNIRPFYKKGNQEWKYASYIPILEKDKVTTTIFGDSFAAQLTANITSSGFSDLDKTYKLENVFITNSSPNKNEWQTLLSKTDVLVLVYTYTKLGEKRIVDDVSLLIDYSL